MNKIKVFFDTNVLIYAHDESSLYHHSSANLLNLVFENKIQGVIAEQNIIEIYRILTNPAAMRNKPLTSQEVNKLINEIYLSGIFEVLYPNHLTTEKTLELAVNYNCVSARIFDIRLAGLVITYPVDYFTTYNTKHFLNIQGLTPMTPEDILCILSC
ncbi:MAG: type II toxin-antitoxin system VapC family toxin [Nostoc sp. EkiNYC01]|nr:PIN domain-containing protein [Nostoc sp. EkiNYC01]